MCIRDSYWPAHERGMAHFSWLSPDRRSVLVRLTSKGEVVRDMLKDLFDRHLSSLEAVGNVGAPDMDSIRAARANMRYHLRYIGHLIGARKWLAGDCLSYADLAAAAHLSSVDYLGDATWAENENAKTWYARVKSRPSFRALLSERLPGMAPSSAYADLDF